MATNNDIIEISVSVSTPQYLESSTIAIIPYYKKKTALISYSGIHVKSGRGSPSFWDAQPGTKSVSLDKYYEIVESLNKTNFWSIKKPVNYDPDTGIIYTIIAKTKSKEQKVMSCFFSNNKLPGELISIIKAISILYEIDITEIKRYD